MPRSGSNGLSLQTRILFITVFIFVSVLVITDWATTLSAVHTVERQIRSQAEKASLQLTEELAGTRSSSIPAEVHSQMDQLPELDPIIRRVDVYAEIKGELRLVDSSSGRRDRALEGRELSAFFDNRPDTFLVQGSSGRDIYSTRPFTFRDRQRGFVTVVSSLRPADEIFSTHSRIRLYLMLAATALLVLAITFVFRTMVYRGVHHLVSVMQRFKEGETAVRADNTLPGEWGALARNLNVMLREIERFDNLLKEEIENARGELAERNRQLEELNLQLFETQKRLTQAGRLALLGRMVATFAHEVGSPLSAISTRLQMVLEDEQLDPRLRQKIVPVNEQVDRVCGIVESLLKTTRRTRRRIPVVLDEIIAKVGRFLGPTLASQGVRFEVEAPGGPFATRGDPDQLQQLFLNLFNNSMDAMERGGLIRVELHRLGESADHGNLIRIDVRDTGIGIPTEKMEHIFEPFFTTKEYGKGTGLGLALSQEIVSLHGGTISVQSETGGGTCFTILLPEIPLVSDDKQAAQETELKAE